MLGICGSLALVVLDVSYNTTLPKFDIQNFFSKSLNEIHFPGKNIYIQYLLSGFLYMDIVPGPLF